MSNIMYRVSIFSSQRIYFNYFANFVYSTQRPFSMVFVDYCLIIFRFSSVLVCKVYFCNIYFPNIYYSDQSSTINIGFLFTYLFNNFHLFSIPLFFLHVEHCSTWLCNLIINILVHFSE